jgi:hypothetical protein
MFWVKQRSQQNNTTFLFWFLQIHHHSYPIRSTRLEQINMDFFGLGNAAEMETPLGQLVKSATDPLLLGPDWAKNLEICDSISTFPEA